MKNNAIHRRFLFGIAGIREGYRRERSFRTHLAFSSAAAGMLFVLQPSATLSALLICALAMSLGLELMNGAIEGLVDHLHPEVHPAIGSVKDMASGGALITNLGAIAVALAIVVDSAGPPQPTSVSVGRERFQAERSEVGGMSPPFRTCRLKPGHNEAYRPAALLRGLG
jgi:diacylglycerol kinase (ATP)